MKDQRTKQRFIELRAQGMSYSRIAQELLVSKQTLIEWSRYLGDEIANLKAIEVDALLERYRLSQQYRLEAFGQTLSKILAELEHRDMKDLSSDKLILLLVKMNEAISQMSISMNFKGKKSNIEDLAEGLCPETPIEWNAGIDNLGEEVTKGQTEKAVQGHWPSYAPLGYKNRLEDHKIVPHPEEAPLVRKAFELAASGEYSLRKLS